MKTTADIEKEAIRENLPEMPSVFQGLFARAANLEELRLAQLYLLCPEPNDWIN